ncbi:MAG: CRTAC1 family protein, partial [Ilumatobacteraceae bacterium]
NHLLRNDGSGVFVDEVGLGVERPATRAGERSITWGVGFYDLDLDGWEDLYLAAGNIGRRDDNPVQSNAVLANDAGTGFLDLSALSGADDPGDSKGVAFADYDADGDVDVFVVNQGGAPRLYRNATPTAGRHWLEVVTAGTESNRDGCGARVEVELDDGTTMVRQIACGSISVSSGSQRAAHFGLGTSTRIARVEVLWPSGTRQVLDGGDVDVDQVLTITEPAA